MIVAGFGFRAGASRESLADALYRAAHGLRPMALATIADKAEASTFRELAALLNLPCIAVTAAEFAAHETTTRSAASLAARRTGSLAEASALAGAGKGARLLSARHISADRMATCALAIGDAE